MKNKVFLLFSMGLLLISFTTAYNFDNENIINNLDDVSIINPIESQILLYNSTSTLWINAFLNDSGHSVNNSLLWDGHLYGDEGHWGINGNDIFYNDGEVGIGTTNPLADLDVRGDITIRSTSDLGSAIDFSISETGGNVPVTFRNTAAGAMSMGILAQEGQQAVFLLRHGTGQTFSGDGFNIGLTTDADGDLAFTSRDSSFGSATRMTIKNTGEVGIGTISPSAPLEVQSSIVNKGVQIYNTNQNSGGSVPIFLSGEDNGGNIKTSSIESVNDGAFTIRTGATTLNGFGTRRLLIDSSGNVGIGLTDPANTLQVNGMISSGNNDGSGGGSTISGEVRSLQSNANPFYISLKTDTPKSGIFRSNTDFFLYYDTSTADIVLDQSHTSVGDILFQIEGSTKMMVDRGTSNIGIGTTSPQNTLNVIGDGNFTQNLTIGEEGFTKFLSETTFYGDPTDNGSFKLEIINSSKFTFFRFENGEFVNKLEIGDSWTSDRGILNGINPQIFVEINTSVDPSNFPSGFPQITLENLVRESTAGFGGEFGNWFGTSYINTFDEIIMQKRESPIITVVLQPIFNVTQNLTFVFYNTTTPSEAEGFTFAGAINFAIDYMLEENYTGIIYTRIFDYDQGLSEPIWESSSSFEFTQGIGGELELVENTTIFRDFFDVGVTLRANKTFLVQTNFSKSVEINGTIINGEFVPWLRPTSLLFQDFEIATYEFEDNNFIGTGNFTTTGTIHSSDVISQGLFDRIDNVTQIDSDTIFNLTLPVLYVADTTNNDITINITFGTNASFQVWDAERKFNQNSVFVNVLNPDGITIDHQLELNTRNKAYQFFFNGTFWFYGEIGKGQFVSISSSHTSIIDFGNLIQENNNNSEITIIGSLEFTGVGIGSQEIISMIPTSVLEYNANWKGVFIDGGALDPTGEGADIVGFEVDFSGINTTNNPVLHGVEITVPPRFDAIHIHEGQLVINNQPTSTEVTEFSAMDIRVDTVNLDSSSVWSAMGITAVGDSVGTIAAVLVRNNVEPIRQEVGTFITPSQTEFAGRKTGGDMIWADGIDGFEIFTVVGNEVYIGSSSQFSQIEVIMDTVATKDVQPTFWYNTAADTWTQFFPDDETSGFQSSSLISWEPDSISGLWTNNGDPAGADTNTGYWIKIIRIRVADIGTPIPTTMKTGTVEAFGWDETGALNINNLAATGNLTIGQKITFAFGEVIDNIVDGWIRINGNLEITGNSGLTVGAITGSGTNGLIDIKGIGGGANSIGGDVRISGGFGLTTPGRVTIKAGTTNAIGADVLIGGGDGPTGLSGSVFISGGTSGDDDGIGGQVQLIGGQGGVDTGNGGDVVIKSGDSNGGGTFGGDVIINAGERIGFNVFSDIIMQEDGGNIGIGTGNPQNKLNVVGDLNVTGNYIHQGNTGFTGSCVNVTYSGGLAISCND